MGASLVAQTVTNVRAMQETQVRSLGQEGAWEKEMATTPVSCLENSTDRGFWWASPWGRKESDMIERLTFSELIYNIVLVSPLQYSCLENPMERGAWRTTVHGVAESWTRLSD